VVDDHVRDQHQWRYYLICTEKNSIPVGVLARIMDNLRFSGIKGSCCIVVLDLVFRSLMGKKELLDHKNL
jgi:hypothetical protein